MKIFDVLKSESILTNTDANRVITTTLQNQNSEIYDGVIESKGRNTVQDNEGNSRRVLLSRAASHKELLKSGKIESAISKVKQVKHRALPEGRNYVDAISKEVKEELRAKNEKEASLSKFREDNKLTHSASYSENPGKVWGYLILAMILEGIINSFFLSKASEFGLVGGFALAFAISFVNLAMALGFVIGLQYFRHVKSGTSLAGAVGLIVSFLIMCGVALLVGHYRAALDEDVDSASSMAVNSLMAEPFGIATFESWLLTAVTIGIFVFFVIKLIFKDELYPGYGKITRETKAARKAYTSKKSQAMKKVSQIKQELNQQFETAHEELNILAKTLEEDSEALDLLYQDYQSYLSLQKSEFETFCEICRQRFSHECTQILDKKADLSKPMPPLEFSELKSLISSEDAALFKIKREAINEFQFSELETLRTEYQNAVNDIDLFKETA
ncbi:hypothetical protein GTQ48_07995 [Alteromonas genovensis]|uniref:Uncharacterized protein n=1 Tax=Alteromonas genovensis TaxID=471225 RepID=A0A6N9TIU8_9ALTE|nr:hypothetical protein [Alteromonas genovensis]NDW15459.1 hypothetical protein [Alteromonas genovensis]